MNKRYSVYRHIFPTGETYIGITGGKVEDRWNNGFGYESQRKFFKRILAVGWDNIRHEIIETDLDEKTAREKERKLIEESSSKDRTKCLNTSEVGATPKVKPNISDFPFREHDELRRLVEFTSRFDDVWRERYYHIFDCYPHQVEINDDSVVLHWFFDLTSLEEYRIPLGEDIVTYHQLWEYLNGGAMGVLLTVSTNPS